MVKGCKGSLVSLLLKFRLIVIPGRRRVNPSLYFAIGLYEYFDEYLRYQS